MDENTTYLEKPIDSSQASSAGVGFVDSHAKIAVYDDMLSRPKIIDIPPAPTREFIDAIAKTTYDHAHNLGGNIPYTVVLQVAENFIHAGFCEAVVSVLDGGNTIRFTDQGPGISDKENALLPGFSSATTEMKKFIDGVGSGLPIVREYMLTKHGQIVIEDNVNKGAVVTVSLVQNNDAEISNSAPSLNNLPLASSAQPSFKTTLDSEKAQMRSQGNTLGLLIQTLKDRQIDILRLFSDQDVWGVQEIHNVTGIPQATVHSDLKKLEEAGMITKLGTKRMLSQLGTLIVEEIA